jgi:hypothetical protein
LLDGRHQAATGGKDEKDAPQPPPLWDEGATERKKGHQHVEKTLKNA